MTTDASLENGIENAVKRPKSRVPVGVDRFNQVVHLISQLPDASESLAKWGLFDSFIQILDDAVTDADGELAPDVLKMFESVLYMQIGYSKGIVDSLNTQSRQRVTNRLKYYQLILDHYFVDEENYSEGVDELINRYGQG